MSNIKEGEGNVVVLHRRYDERFVRFIRAFIAITDPCPDAELEDADGRGAEQVLFDIDVDGNRYLLIKTASVERGAVALSPREREIVRMVAQGRQNKVIAAVLNISSWTVCTHLRRIFAKLGVTSRAAMVAKVADIEGAIDLKETVEGSAGATPRRPA
jgi:two-component system, NarL family, nitrate/nitrite response regulator NarL